MEKFDDDANSDAISIRVAEAEKKMIQSLASNN